MEADPSPCRQVKLDWNRVCFVNVGAVEQVAHEFEELYCLASARRAENEQRALLVVIHLDNACVCCQQVISFTSTTAGDTIRALHRIGSLRQTDRDQGIIPERLREVAVDPDRALTSDHRLPIAALLVGCRRRDRRVVMLGNVHRCAIKRAAQVVLVAADRGLVACRLWIRLSHHTASALIRIPRHSHYHPTLPLCPRQQPRQDLLVAEIRRPAIGHEDGVERSIGMCEPRVRRYSGRVYRCHGSAVAAKVYHYQRGS